MRFAPEYVSIVLNENFEDAKELLLTPLMAINYAHLVMLTECGIVSRDDARVLRTALDGISLDTVREVTYDGTYEDLFFFIERLIDQSAGEDIAGRLHTARSRNDIAMTMYRFRQREFIAAATSLTARVASRNIDHTSGCRSSSVSTMSPNGVLCTAVPIACACPTALLVMARACSSATGFRFCGMMLLPWTKPSPSRR